MCLIAYVPAGKRIPENYINAAAAGNRDGIGIMSSLGIDKFSGKRAVKRARRRARVLSNSNTEFAMHFRYATHGLINLENIHPFQTPNGSAYIMHNGVLSRWAPPKDSLDSDTRIFVDKMLDDAPTDLADGKYWDTIERIIGYGNKFCVMAADGSKFLLLNERAGDWIEGIWYSQTYSLPITRKWMGNYGNYENNGGYGRAYMGSDYYDEDYWRTKSGTTPPDAVPVTRLDHWRRNMHNTDKPLPGTVRGAAGIVRAYDGSRPYTAGSHLPPDRSLEARGDALQVARTMSSMGLSALEAAVRRKYPLPALSLLPISAPGHDPAVHRILDDTDTPDTELDRLNQTFVEEARALDTALEAHLAARTPALSAEEELDTELANDMLPGWGEVSEHGALQ